MDIPRSLSDLLASARKRCIAHLMADQSAFATMIAMAGVILLLVAGTQILNWYWVVLLAAGSLGVGLYRFRKSVPSQYELAQEIDQRLNLADTLSTATYFSTHEGNGDPAVREQQQRGAEKLAQSVDLNKGVPFSRPRFAYPALGLALVACALFAVRYAATGTLDLQPSLVKIAFDTFFGSNPTVAKNIQPKQTKNGDAKETDPDNPNSDLKGDDAKPDEPPTVDEPEPADKNGKKADSKDGSDRPPEEAKDKEGQEGQNHESDDPGADGNKSPQSDNAKNSNPQNGKQDGQQGDQSSSMFSKLRDAVENMLNNMRPGQQGQKQSSNQQKGDQAKGDQQNGARSESQAKSGGAGQPEKGDKGQESDSQGQEGKDDATSKSASDNSKSGIGSQDGDKKVREAAELAAMGKISELLGKRSATVTGEMVVEVGSGKQQLKTPLSVKQAQHAEAGGEINRDEVPLIYQQFVQQYFEEVRKAPPAAAKDPAAVPAAAGNGRQ